MPPKPQTRPMKMSGFKGNILHKAGIKSQGWSKKQTMKKNILRTKGGLLHNKAAANTAMKLFKGKIPIMAKMARKGIPGIGVIH